MTGFDAGFQVAMFFVGFLTPIVIFVVAVGLLAFIAAFFYGLFKRGQ